MFIISFPLLQTRASCWDEVMKSTFFLVACVVLCPVWMTQTGLITHMVDNTPLSSAGATVMPPVSLSTTSDSPKCGGCVREQSGQLTPTDQRDTSHQLILWSAEIDMGKIEKGRDVHAYSICLPNQALYVLRPLFPESRWRSACWWQVVNQFLIFLCLQNSHSFLLFPLKCDFLNTIPFAFLNFIFLPISWGRGLT